MTQETQFISWRADFATGVVGLIALNLPLAKGARV